MEGGGGMDVGACLGGEGVAHFGFSGGDYVYVRTAPDILLTVFVADVTTYAFSLLGEKGLSFFLFASIISVVFLRAAYSHD